MSYRIELDRSKKPFTRQKWFSRIVDISNGEILYHSENHANRIDALAVATKMARHMTPPAIVVDISKGWPGVVK